MCALGGALVSTYPRRMMAVHSAFKKAETTPSMRRRDISVKRMKGNPTNTKRRVNVCLSLNRAAARVRLKKDTTKARLCILTEKKHTKKQK